MEFKKIIELFAELNDAQNNGELEWVSMGKTRYETNWNGQEIVIDRRNNLDVNSQEIYLKIDEFEEAYQPESEEFTSLVEIIDTI